MGPVQLGPDLLGGRPARCAWPLCHQRWDLHPLLGSKVLAADDAYAAVCAPVGSGSVLRSRGSITLSSNGGGGLVIAGGAVGAASESPGIAAAAMLVQSGAAVGLKKMPAGG